MVQIDEGQARNAGPFLCDYLDRTSNRKLAEMGMYAYAAWRSYLTPDVWPEMMAW